MPERCRIESLCYNSFIQLSGPTSSFFFVIRNFWSVDWLLHSFFYNHLQYLPNQYPNLRKLLKRYGLGAAGGLACFLCMIADLLIERSKLFGKVKRDLVVILINENEKKDIGFLSYMLERNEFWSLFSFITNIYLFLFMQIREPLLVNHPKGPPLHSEVQPSLFGLWSALWEHSFQGIT